MDIIAYLYPHADYSWSADLIKGNPHHVPARRQRTAYSYKRRTDRESTEPLDDHDENASALDYQSYLEIKFSDIPRTDRGLIFGFNSCCDVFLPHESVSNTHFSLTFDPSNRPVIKDLNSLRGTEVTYNGEGSGARRDFQWIIGGHQTPAEKKTIVVTIPDTISFQIVVKPHDITTPAYIDKVNRFKQGRATTDHLLRDLGLSKPLTRPRTGSHTPGTGEIHLRKRLGQGSFGVVTYLWNVSTGEEHVVKEPPLNIIRKRKVDKEAWLREARIMSQVSHPHIVQLIGSSFSPHPQLYLEYVPRGALDDHEDISYNETLEITRQCLSALAYLHGMARPIAHRDIKPANILVQHRFNGDISVKLGDFGLARDRAELTTMCGTQKYLAPEVYSELQRHVDKEARLGYTATVDIWSLGVVAYELACGLPFYKDWYRNNGVDWCESVVTKLRNDLKKTHNDFGEFLLRSMVVLSPDSRFCAAVCYDLALRLPKAQTDHAWVPASSPGEQDQTTVRYTVRNDPAGHPAAVVESRSTPKSHRTKSGAPSPSSGLLVQQQEAPSSSAMRRHRNQQTGHELTHFGEDHSSILQGDENIPRGEMRRDADEYDEYDEMAQAALLLQAIRAESGEN